MQPTLINATLKYWLLQPAPALRDRVSCYFVVDAGENPYHADELLLPDGYSEIVFALQAGFERRVVGQANRCSVMRRSYLIGGRSSSVVTGGAQRLHLVGVKLDPRFLRSVIEVPLGEFSNATLELRDLNARPLLDLEDAVAACRSVEAIAATLDRYFLRELQRMTTREASVDWALRRMHEQRGVGSVAAWAREANVPERTFERRFIAAIGMVPKKYARIVRFRHAYRQLIANQSSGPRRGHGWLDGYYDQAHFIKEFRYFTGTSPTTLLGARAPSSRVVNDHLLLGDSSMQTPQRPLA